MTTISVASLQHPCINTSYHIDMKRVTTVVLCGGQGSRLFPLTQSKCKPAMSYGGRHRLVDFPLSNAINSGCRNIYVLTQFLSNTLHKHVFDTYRNSVFIQVLTSEETPQGRMDFKGTADAVRKIYKSIDEAPGDYVLILSGDQIFKMDFRNLMKTALDTNADVVVASLPVSSDEAPRMGILQINEENAITAFCEKPKTQQQLTPYTFNGGKYLASMGIYLCKKEVLKKLLQEESREDFGQHIIPYKVSQGNIYTHIHQGYWEDIGTISSFYHANIALTLPHPPFNLDDDHWPLYTQPTSLPGAKIGNTNIRNAILCEGCYVEAKELTHSILGPRTYVHKGCSIRNTYILGHDFYEGNISTPTRFSIGRNTVIDRAIIDKHVTIGSHVRLTNEQKKEHYDSDIAYIRDGVIVIPRGSTIPDGYIL